MIKQYTSWPRRFLTGLLVICIFLTCTPAASADEGDTDSDGTFEWIELADGSVEITKYLGTEHNVTIPDQLGGKDVTAIGIGAFQNNITLREVILSDSIVSIGSRAFYYCQCLTSVTLSANLETIGQQTFYHCGFTSINLPEKLTTIGTHAFCICNNLETITIPSGVKEIGERAFVSCSKLKTVILSTGLTSIRYRAFDSCKLLNTIAVAGTVPVEGTCKFPSTLTSISSEAFQYCEALQSVDIPNTIKTIESGTFKGCKLLASVTLPEGLTTINDYAFYQCVLSEVTLPSTLTTLGSYAFGINMFTKITIPEKITDIGKGAFWGCSLLTSVTLPSGLQSIGNGTFSNCSQLPGILLPSGLQSIGSSAFSYCGKMTGITIPSGVTKIENSTFYQCTSLKNISLHDEITSIGSSAFHECTVLESFSMPPLVNTIGTRAFKNCSLIPEILIPEGVSVIQAGTFLGCTKLTNVTIPSTVNRIALNAFSDCDNLIEVTIPATVTNPLEDEVFSGCDQLEKVIFMSKSLYMGNNIFADTAINNDGIYGLTGSRAQTYAANNGHPFHVIYAVSFDRQGGSSVPDMAAPDGVICAPEDPTKTGCVFGGWYETPDCSGNQVSFPYSVTADMTLYAKWVDGYIVTFDSQGGSATEEKTVVQGSSVDTHEVPTQDGCLFDGWYKTSACNAEDKITFPYTPTSNVTLYAKWLDAYTVTFDALGGSAVADKTAAQGTPISTPDDPTKTGYVFDGWYETAACDGAEVMFPYTGTSDILLYAKWLDIYTLTFDSQGGNSVASKSAVQGTAISAPEAPTQDGYVFDGWYETAACDGAKIAFPYICTSDILLYAKWLNIYTVTFDSLGGSSVALKTAESGHTITEPNVPAKDGYVFSGWYKTPACNGEKVTFPYTVASDVTLYAKWLQSYQITLMLPGGSVIIEGNTINEPEEPARSGYIFEGWYNTPECDGQQVTFPCAITGDTALYPKWTLVEDQLITIVGTLLDENGEPLEGYMVELHSTLRTAVTDSRGRYTFTDVEIADHSLTVKDTSGVILKSFAVAVKAEDKFAWSKPNDESIIVVVQEDTASINVTIKLGKDGEVTVDKIENVVNPQTGDVQQNLVWALVIVGVLVICTMLIFRKQTA